VEESAEEKEIRRKEGRGGKRIVSLVPNFWHSLVLELTILENGAIFPGAKMSSGTMGESWCP
jgi:hypothetical protein